MKKLTTQNYWDEIWFNDRKVKKFNPIKILILFFKKILGEKAENYTEYILWEIIYKKYLPQQKGLKILEIGSAPGWNLVKFNKKFAYEPFGIEFSSVGAERNRQKFIGAKLNPENVIEADFFSPDIHNKYQEFFDLVMSGGFIEHFDDVKETIAKHLNLLKKGGILIISVPNLQGLNKFLAKFFYKGIESTHNFSILNKERLEEQFNDFDLEKIYCNYFGVLYFNLFVLDNKSRLKYWFYRFLVRIQSIMNYLFRIIFDKKPKESKFFSPYIIFIARKK